MKTYFPYLLFIWLFVGCKKHTTTEEHQQFNAVEKNPLIKERVLCNGFVMTVDEGDYSNKRIIISDTDYIHGEILLKVLEESLFVIEKINKSSNMQIIRKSKYRFTKGDLPKDVLVDPLSKLSKYNLYIPYIDFTPCYLRNDNPYNSYLENSINHITDSIWIKRKKDFVFSNYQETIIKRDAKEINITKIGNKICSYKNPTFCEEIDTISKIKILKSKEDHISFKGFDSNLNLKINLLKKNEDFIDNSSSIIDLNN